MEQAGDAEADKGLTHVELWKPPPCQGELSSDPCQGFGVGRRIGRAEVRQLEG